MMRLRSRGPGARQARTSNSTSSDPTDRPVLGDVSNKRTLSSDEETNTGKSSHTFKKSKTKNSCALPVGCSVVTQENNDIGVDETDGIRVDQVTETAKTKHRFGSRVLSRVTRSSARTRSRSIDETKPEIDESQNNSKRARTSSSTRQPAMESSTSDPASYSDNEDAIEDKSPTEKIADPQKFDKSIIPLEHRLMRTTFNGLNVTKGINVVDKVDKGNVLMVTDYVSDLFQHFYVAESLSRPRMYMKDQRDINAKMRAILIDWLVEVHMKFRLVPETLYLCVNIIDRYCNHVQVARSRLQLVGVTALLIACKYEEIYPPEVRDCVYITDRAYQRQEVLDMEQDMLQRLRFKITVPTAYPFLLRFLNVTRASPLARVAAHYYTERTLQEHDLLRFKPSVVAASAVILAINNPDILAKENNPELSAQEATEILLEYSEFRVPDVIECAGIIARKVQEEPVTASRRHLLAVKRKFDKRNYLHISAEIQLPSANHIPNLKI